MAGPPSNPPHPPLNLQIHLQKPLRMSSRGPSVHLSLDYDVHSRRWWADADAASSTTEIAGSEFPSPTQRPRQACAQLVQVLLSRKESLRSTHGSARRSGLPAWTHLGDVMQTQTHLRILILESRPFRRMSFPPRK